MTDATALVAAQALFERNKRNILRGAPVPGSRAWQRLSPEFKSHYRGVSRTTWATLAEVDRTEYLEQVQTVMDAIGIP